MRISDSDGLLRLLDLEGEGARTDEDIFLGATPESPHARVFGGQVLAQAVVGASRTVEPDRGIHSMHAYFLRPGDAHQPITFGVQRLRDGRSFSARRVHAYQNGVPILSMVASFQVPSQGLEHQAEIALDDVPEPESLPTTADLLGKVEHPAAQDWAFNRPFDVRHVTAPLYLRAPDASERTPSNAVWFKTFGEMPQDQATHRAALAYASDYTILEPVLRRHGVAWTRRGMSVASLDHAMWWHRDVRTDDWLLYVQESPSASGARGLGVGKIFARDGILVASVAQEGMLRLPEI
ncbi:acyl-CoA thioesterase-2 [Zhihengliuella flava]|uniref:Acyl-CoA thioesterase 2 n=1 Tax=Zhihengliuella flava TaxID=1285193 RepID=A0A931D6F6_9MICC|nr:acyl-CoA thioesterase-2 [Zhihengliuella flava]